MAIAYLGLGTNIGNKRRNMITAAALLAERVGDILALSGFYETEPWEIGRASCRERVSMFV